MVLPWVHAVAAASAFTRPADAAIGSASRGIYAPATELAGDLLLRGARRMAQRGWPGWARGIRELEERGCHKVVGRLREVQADPARVLFFLKLWRLALNQADG